MTTEWAHIPAELRDRPQWLLAGPNDKGELKVPLTVDFSGHLRPGSSTDRTTWLDFDTAADAATERGYGLGYVLAADDPYCCVDFDVKNHHNAPDKPDTWTSEQALRGMHMMVEDLASYTELSQSGQGVHVWVRANIGPGLKKNGVEVYSQERFIACTGRVVHDLPIEDRQDDVSQLVAEMRAAQQATRAAGLDEGSQDLTDEQVMERAWNADNADKFRALWAGQWQQYGYPSQSEADLSLMSMLTFYSRHDEQCRRLFRNSELGARDKAQKDDRYLDFTLKLIRGRQAKEDAVQEQAAAQAAAMIERMRAPMPAADVAAATAYAARLQAQQAAQAPPAPTAAPAAPDTGLAWPPGLAGAIARFVYDSAPRPVKEVGIVAALGFLAGVCGKAWVIPNSGLNLYVILVARSGIGKEAMHSGLGALIGRLRTLIPSAQNYIDFSDFASGPALSKACAQQSSFCNVAGEFGHKLKRMANDMGNDGPMRQLRTVMTNLYQKSGPTSVVGGITYSSKDNNVASVSGVAFSMIGETTPSTLYESLTESMMEDGFLSRFTVVEYVGTRPPLNPSPAQFPSNELTELCAGLVVQATSMIGEHRRGGVARTEAAGALMDAFDLECDAQINSSEDESWRQMWNRAHLKMCRVAALLAVADNPAFPCVQQVHAEWALDLIRRDIGVMRRRIETGDVGSGDSARERKICHLLREYITADALPESYGVMKGMQKAGVVPRKFIQLRTQQIASFSKHKLGSTIAMDQALRSLIDSGYLLEMDKAAVSKEYTYQGRCFRIVQLPSH